ncbi:MAG: DegT/DnrJ/EryC1/StrS aminotransferase [Bacteroidetes bacterium]|nr:DegT/DnrJ/EryC1/StrS aminotransferase [Bacteroidota bacterium]
MARQQAADYYDKAFSGCEKITVPFRNEKTTHVFHQYTLKLDGVDRTALQKKLLELGIPAMVYYPVPLHMQKAYNNSRYKEGDFPVAEMLCSCVLSLPMHTELDEEQLEYITKSILNLIS